MPASNQADINIISPENSVHNLNLGVNAFFNGTIIDVSDYTTITVTAAGNLPGNTADALQIEWYDLDNVFVSLTTIGAGGATFNTLHSTIRTSKMRVRYHAGGSGQTNLHVETLLRKGNIAGNVSPVGLITGTPDAQNVNSVLMGRRESGGAFVPLAASIDTNAYLITVPPPPRSVAATITTAASLTAVNLDPNISPQTRRFGTVFNDTIRANLYIRLGATPTLSLWEYKIPPQHLFTIPQAWPAFGASGSAGRVVGIWDGTDGFARYLEGT